MGLTRKQSSGTRDDKGLRLAGEGEMSEAINVKIDRVMLHNESVQRNKAF